MVDLIHACPGRARFRVPLLADRSLDPHYVRGYIEAVPGVSRARLNVKARSVVVEHARTEGVRERVAEALRGLAENRPPRRARPARSGPEPGDALPLVAGVGLLLTLPLLPRPLKAALTWAHIAGTLKAGAGKLLERGITVEVLDATAVGLTALRGDYLATNITQTLLSLASYVEGTTRRASDDLLAHLMRPDLAEVWVEDADGSRRRVPAESVDVGARVVVSAGETIPVDGTVADGLATVNQAAVTGESLPQPKEPGSAVISGSVVEEGRLTILAERIGAATTMARIATFLREALEDDRGMLSKAAELADRRVAITLVAGLAVLALTRDPRRLESLFLVDFSCAVKLGTSVAIKAAMGNAAHAGVLIKGGAALEGLAQADTVVFDKTGTLTHNALDVASITCLGPLCLSEDALLALVASVAEHSTHPVAGAVVGLAESRQLAHIDHEAVDFVIGHGLSTLVNGRPVRIGSRHFLEEHEAVDFAPYEDVLADLTADGSSLLYIGTGGQPHGVIALRDRMRADAPEIVTALRDAGVERLVLITGDPGRSGRDLGARLGLDTVHDGIAPEDKARIVAELQAEGRRVAFVGDGVNDAPALMAADVGIAMPRGADIARATADVVLTEDDLAGVARTRRLATRTLSRIDRNFRASAVINTVVLVGAALGRLPPAWTALLHNGTTIGVLLSAHLGGRADARVAAPVALPAPEAERTSDTDPE
ncbi:heavy metal translocating P-type ATPase [Roseospira marina]|uniref:P-type Zn(2+) transporter n=1 Tax=Roseospira marina TaxID=140057 RepID=A0A5M6IBX1_9PROT|nr:heavy metal translocating P-type ATPase [Roseospira marina]KAA5605239.1 heavy metal translocating P-type ATPase [Roseospira marina]MBB4314698.1 heavy metal translocating P-type ATPase [Roseospira marina]MBB5087687.1 heavy metal translocating P-type ATPase [Roseospira marina]